MKIESENKNFSCFRGQMTVRAGKNENLEVKKQNFSGTSRIPGDLKKYDTKTFLFASGQNEKMKVKKLFWKKFHKKVFLPFLEKFDN